MRWQSSIDPSSFGPDLAPSVRTAAMKSGRFFLEGVRGPMRAEVAHEDASGMTLRQELPFLQLQGKLRDENGREGCLENVSVAVRDGVPSLLLDIRYDDARRDSTLPFLMDSTRARRAVSELATKNEGVDPLADTLAVSPKKERRDQTVPYGIACEAENTEVPMPTVEELRPYTVPDLALRPRRNPWWMRLWRRWVVRFL